MTNDTDDDLMLLDDRQFGELIGVSRVKLWDLRRSGELPPAVKVGNKNLAPRRDGIAFIKRKIAERDARAKREAAAKT